MVLEIKPVCLNCTTDPEKPVHMINMFGETFRCPSCNKIILLLIEENGDEEPEMEAVIGDAE